MLIGSSAPPVTVWTGSLACKKPAQSKSPSRNGIWICVRAGKTMAGGAPGFNHVCV